jgi:hypothetical protein
MSLLQAIPSPKTLCGDAAKALADLIQTINSLDEEDPIRLRVFTPLILDVIQEKRTLAEILYEVVCLDYPDEKTLHAAQRALFTIGWGHIRLQLKTPT